MSAAPDLMLVSIIAGLSQLSMLAFYVFGIFYAARRRSAAPHAASLAIWAMGLLLVDRLFTFACQVAGARLLPPGGFVMAMTLANLVASIIGIAALFMLLKAVFVDRANVEPNRTLTDVGGVPLADRPSENPYASPRQ